MAVSLVRRCTGCRGKAVGTADGFSGRKSAETGFAQQMKQPAISCPARIYHRSGTQEIMLHGQLCKTQFLKLFRINSLWYHSAMKQEEEEQARPGETEETFWFCSERFEFLSFAGL